MRVSPWAVLGLILLVFGLPVVLLAPNIPGFSYLVGAGVAFLIVPVSQAAWSHWVAGQDDLRAFDDEFGQ